MICVINYEAMIARTMASECNECGVIGTGAKKCILQKTDHCGLGSLLINEQPPRRTPIVSENSACNATASSLAAANSRILGS